MWTVLSFSTPPCLQTLKQDCGAVFEVAQPDIKHQPPIEERQHKTSRIHQLLLSLCCLLLCCSVAEESRTGLLDNADVWRVGGGAWPAACCFGCGIFCFFSQSCLITIKSCQSFTTSAQQKYAMRICCSHPNQNFTGNNKHLIWTWIPTILHILMFPLCLRPLSSG